MNAVSNKVSNVVSNIYKIPQFNTEEFQEILNDIDMTGSDWKDWFALGMSVLTHVECINARGAKVMIDKSSVTCSSCNSTGSVGTTGAQ